MGNRLAILTNLPSPAERPKLSRLVTILTTVHDYTTAAGAWMRAGQVGPS